VQKLLLNAFRVLPDATIHDGLSPDAGGITMHRALRATKSVIVGSVKNIGFLLFGTRPTETGTLNSSLVDYAKQVFERSISATFFLDRYAGAT
jgi:hypothetical protein